MALDNYFKPITKKTQSIMHQGYKFLPENRSIVEFVPVRQWPTLRSDNNKLWNFRSANAKENICKNNVVQNGKLSDASDYSGQFRMQLKFN